MATKYLYIYLLAISCLQFKFFFAYAKQCDSNPNGMSYDVDWGTYSSSTSFTTLTCLRIRNDRPYQRKEVAYSGVPIGKTLNIFNIDLDRLVIIGSQNKRIPAQFNILSRWGGAVTNSSKPVRWLEVAIPVLIIPNSFATFELRLYNTPQPHTVDTSYDVVVSSSGNQHIISTGVAQFTIDQTLPALLSNIIVGSNTMLANGANSDGPTITYIPQQSQFGSNARTLTQNEATISFFEITETSPVKATFLAEGGWSDQSGASICNTFNDFYVQPYESFTYSLALTFFRGRSDFKVQYHVRNQCSNGDGSSWIDQSFLINKASYSLDFSAGIAATPSSSHFYGGPSNTNVSSGLSSGGTVTTIVEQRRGNGGNQWRNSRVTHRSTTLSDDNVYSAPIIAVSNENYLVGTTLAYMQYREPQALRIEGSVVSIDVISEQQRVGEGKGIWNHAMYFIRNVMNSDITTELQSIRWPLVLEIERGLLIHANPEYYTDTGAMPPLGQEGIVTPLKTSYIAMMERMHSDTINTQWESAKTYGSQIWPDIQYDGYNINNANPYQNDPHHGYWNPHAHELVEYFRSGDPKWAHDLALPLSWLMTYTAYLNVGRTTQDYVRNGLCVNSGGSGDGQWHRNGGGSDDYMYNLAMKHAYVLRPDPIHRRRIEMTGRTVRIRYTRSTAEADRDIYLERLDIARGVIQHMEAGCNCAEFGKEGGNLCHNWFMAVMSELIVDNLSTGSICQPDTVRTDGNGRTCPQAQTFMQVSMMYEFFMRVYLNYGDLNGGMLKAVQGIPENLYTYAVDKSGPVINFLGDHAYLLDCTTNAARTALTSCTYDNVPGDGSILYLHNINSLMSTILLGHFFKPSLGYCSVIEAAWSNGNAITTSWESIVVNNAGWIKGTSQMMSLMAYGVGMLDICRMGETSPPNQPPVISPPVTPPSASPVQLSPSNPSTLSPVHFPSFLLPTSSPVNLYPITSPTSYPSRVSPVTPPSASPVQPSPMFTPTNTPVETPILTLPPIFCRMKHNLRHQIRI